jgi:HAMP domain-containing protein
MDIRTKLIFAFVLTALASMTVLGGVFYGISAELLRSISIRQLESLAAARQQDFAIVADAWFDQVRLISSRTNLRDSVQAHFEAPSPQQIESLQRIVADAQASVELVTRVAVFDAEGDPLAVAGQSAVRAQALDFAASSATAASETRPEVVLTRFVLRADGGVDAHLHAPLVLDGAVIGSIEAVVNTDTLRTVTGDYTGLGETGEFYLVAELSPSMVTVLNPLRHRADARLLSLPNAQAGLHVREALRGAEGVYQNTIDYRGVEVWAATRAMTNFFPGGLIVKIDADEELKRLYDLRAEMLDVGLALVAFAVLGGTLIGARLARPLRDLATVVNQIREGETDVRADIGGEDEVSFLAESFNELMDHLQSDERGAK